jgi:hypothetical protein
MTNRTQELEMPFSEEPSGVAPVTKAERWLTSSALSHIEEENALHLEGSAQADLAYHRRESERLERQREKAELQQMEASPKRNSAAEDQKKRIIARIEKKLADSLKRDEQNHTKFANATNMIEEFIRDGLKGPTVDFQVTDTAIEGKSDAEMMAFWRDESRALRKQRDLTEHALLAPFELIASAIKTSVVSRGRETIFSDVMRPRGPRGRPGLVHFPEILSGGQRVIDTKGLLFDLFSDEIVERLIEGARAKYRPELAMTDDERKAKLAELDALIDDADRKAVFWFRQLRGAGTAAPIPTSNMWAFLGIKPAR